MIKLLPTRVYTHSNEYVSENYRGLRLIDPFDQKFITNIPIVSIQLLK